VDLISASVYPQVASNGRQVVVKLSWRENRDWNEFAPKCAAVRSPALCVFVILLLLYFVWLAARCRKNWPRWVLIAALVLSVISLFQVIGERGVELDSGIEIVSCVVTLVGLYFSYTGDAQGWFNA
jgi:hypothetical protein